MTQVRVNWKGPTRQSSYDMAKFQHDFPDGFNTILNSGKDVFCGYYGIIDLMKA